MLLGFTELFSLMENIAVFPSVHCEPSLFGQSSRCSARHFFSSARYVSLSFALARPVEGLLAIACSLSELSEVFPGNFSYFSDFYSISVISIFFENFSHSKALTNIYILIREVLEKTNNNGVILYFFF